MKNVVLGIGTGRCGTLAFSKLVNRQPFTIVTHEYGRCGDFEWMEAGGEKGRAKAEKRYLSYKQRLLKNTGSGRRYNKLAGDVALWKLPYKMFENSDQKTNIFNEFLISFLTVSSGIFFRAR